MRLLITGNELVPPGEPRAEFQIYESNSSVLNSLLVRDGAELESLRRIEDDRESIRRGMVDAGADVILVSGGSSVGSEDHAPSVLADQGELAIHGGGGHFRWLILCRQNASEYCEDRKQDQCRICFSY